MLQYLRAKYATPSHSAALRDTHGKRAALRDTHGKRAALRDTGQESSTERHTGQQGSTERHRAALRDTGQESSTERHRLVTHCLSTLCQDQGYRLWLTADGILDSQGLSAGIIWAVCYNETDGVGYDAGIRVRRSRVVQVSGHTGLL